MIFFCYNLISLVGFDTHGIKSLFKVPILRNVVIYEVVVWFSLLSIMKVSLNEMNIIIWYSHWSPQRILPLNYHYYYYY